MSKGVIVSGYQISNALIAALLVASTAGAGVATDSFSGVTEGLDNPLSSPSENVTDVNNTNDTNDSDDSQDSSDSSDGSEDQDSDSSDSDSGSSDSSGSDSSDSDDSSDSSEDDGGFLDDVLGGDEEENQTDQDSGEENTTDTGDQTNETDTGTNETDTGTNETDTGTNETDSGTNETTSSVEISQLTEPEPAEFSQPYESATVPVEIVLDGDNAEYEITVDGETYFDGQLSGSATINESIELSSTGLHDLVVEITRSGEVLESMTRTFEIASDAIQETGFTKTTTVRTGSDAGFRLVDNGENVADATVYLDGSSVGQTDSNGEITVSVPYKENITLSTDYSGIEDQTFAVTQDIPEPEITLVDPVDSESFDTPTGQDKDVQFEASVEITENSGTASVMIDGSEAYTQDLSSGTNSISTTQALSGGSHSWSIKVNTEEFDTTSNKRGLTVNERESREGLSLQSDPVAGEGNIVSLYKDNNPVEDEEILVNGNSVGLTDSNGEVQFSVPNNETLRIETGSMDYELTRDVSDVYSFDVASPKDGKVYWKDNTTENVTVDFEFDSTRAGVNYSLYLDSYKYSDGEASKGTNTVTEEVSSGNYFWSLRYKTGEGEVLETEERTLEVWNEFDVKINSLDTSQEGFTINFDTIGKDMRSWKLHADDNLLETNNTKISSIEKSYDLDPGTYELNLSGWRGDVTNAWETRDIEVG